MIRISAIISLIGNVIFFVITLFEFIPNKFDNTMYLFGYITILFITSSNILFIKRSNFGKIDNSEIQQLETENTLLKLKIEQEKMRKILE